MSMIVIIIIKFFSQGLFLQNMNDLIISKVLIESSLSLCNARGIFQEGNRLEDNMFVSNWFAGINCIILLLQI